MIVRFASILVLLSATAFGLESPAFAGGGVSCSISPDQVSVEIDPAFFENDELPDTETEQIQALFHPQVVDFDSESSGALWARFSLTIRGTTYRDTVGFLTPVFFPNAAGPYTSTSGWNAAFFGSFQFLFADVTKPFPGVFTYESLVSAFLDPESYPIVVEVTYSANNTGSSVCSLAYEFVVQPGRGWLDLDLGQYLDRVADDGSALPDTV